MAPHSSTLAWKIPCVEEPDRLQSMGSLRVDTTERLHFHFSLSCIGEGNGNPLQCCCLENLRDGGAWWAAVYGIAQSWTQPTRLSSSSSSREDIPRGIIGSKSGERGGNLTNPSLLNTEPVRLGRSPECNLRTHQGPTTGPAAQSPPHCSATLLPPDQPRGGGTPSSEAGEEQASRGQV